MDHEFRQNETGTDPEDRRYREWLDDVGRILGKEVREGSGLENELFDYYSDDCTPQEAADEHVAQQQLED